MAKKIIVNSEVLAGIEDTFDERVFSACHGLLSSCMNPIDEVGLYQIFIDNDYHHKFKEAAYALFEELGYDIQSDGTNF